MIKKVFSVAVMLALIVMPLSRCAKSEELSGADINEIFSLLCKVIGDAMQEAAASATYTDRRWAQGMHPQEVVTGHVSWNGTGEYAGFSFDGEITFNTDSGAYAGNYTFVIGLYDASSSLKKTVILNSATGWSQYSGNASASIFHAETHYDFSIIIDGKQYQGGCDYDLDCVGTSYTLEGAVVIGGKTYPLHQTY